MGVQKGKDDEKKDAILTALFHAFKQQPEEGHPNYRASEKLIMKLEEEAVTAGATGFEIAKMLYLSTPKDQRQALFYASIDELCGTGSLEERRKSIDILIQIKEALSLSEGTA